MLPMITVFREASSHDRIKMTECFSIKPTVKILKPVFHIQDMPEVERHKEEERLKEVEVKYNTYAIKIKEARQKFGITGIK